MQALEGAAAVREDDRIRFSIVAGPEGYVTGEETAVLNFLSRGVAKPTFVPPRPYERGLGGRPTLIQNAETCAQIALIARFGSDWFRELGSEADPGSALVTISGAVATPGVYELAFGTPMTDLIAAAGGPASRCRRCWSVATSAPGSGPIRRCGCACPARICAGSGARWAPAC